MSSNDELVGLFKNQIKTEEAIVDSVKTGLAEIKNLAVKGVLRAISLDSVKHAEMYSSAIILLNEIPQALTEENLEKQKELLKKHIQLETEVIEKLVEALPNVKNNKVKLLLEAILSDEKRHHELLTKILKILVKGETITDDDWWDMLWENVPFHGAPGG
ncbi:MAG: ferritin-like domain-containing protein [Candidatus Bathyarchaeota archaeon]|nr:MAG: ferritin-like domain-containing protein [Candidatus Bathyarchaeota archaeon]